MPKEHYESAREHIDHGDAAPLFPVDELDAPVLQHRDAQLALEDTESTHVIAVAPTSMASSYFLTQHPLTAIPVDTLPQSVITTLESELPTPIREFDLIQIGKWSTDSVNHSLAEFQTA